MNRYRLNQILEILLFPLIDSKMGEQDYLLSCYQIYEEFKEITKDSAIGVRARKKRNNQYRQAKNSLIEYLTERNHWRVKSEDDVEKICDLFYSMFQLEEHMDDMRYRLDVPEHLDVKVTCIDSYYLLKILPEISLSLITYRDGIAAIRPWIDKGNSNGINDIFNSGSVFNKIEIWNLLGRMMAPDLLIAVAAVEHKLGIEALYEQDYNLVLADKLLVKSLQNGLAENHLHFNVGIDYEIVWISDMCLDFVEKVNPNACGKEIFARIQLALFRCIAACFLESDADKIDFHTYLAKQSKEYIVFYEMINSLYKGKYEGQIREEYIADIAQLYLALRHEDSFFESDYLFDKVYDKYIEYKTTSEFILLYKCYQYVKTNVKDTYFMRVFLQYIRRKNELYYNYHEKYLLQGLKYFQKKYGASKSAASESLSKDELMVEIFRSQSKIKSLRKLEIRVAPDVSDKDLNYFDYSESRNIILEQLYKQLQRIFYSYKQFILESVFGVRGARGILKQEKAGNLTSEEESIIYDKIAKTAVNIPSMGIVFHFLKQKFLEDEAGYYCWKRVLKYEEYKYSYCMLKRYYLRDVAVALEEIRQTIPKIDEYIVGIDAASDENADEPWMFASAYRVMRSHLVTKPVAKCDGYAPKFGRLQNIGFTYHVGEDFRHILSGLRHVDEVLENFGYKPGDRLGHALVLGTDIGEWIGNNEVVALPILEYLENMLWLWGANLYYNVDIGKYAEILEDEILKIAHKIYPSPETISVRMLYQAYRCKFEDEHKEVAMKYVDDLEHSDYKFCKWDECKKEYRTGWTEEKLLLTHYCPVFAEKYNQAIMVSVKQEELEIYKRVQSYLVEKTARKGVYIEVNPSSNLTIGEFGNMSQHPIFFLNSKGDGTTHHAMVTINSDDPLVFGTNVENELSYIYYAAEKQGVSKEDILAWIDKIRIHGMNSSFIQSEKDKVQIFQEVNDILRQIEGTRIC